MRHNIDGRKLGRNATHRRAMYRNLVISLITHGRIRTTTPKAKEARRLADRMVTFAKRGDLAARRHVARILHDKRAVQKLFDEIGPRYADRPGGYTRVLKFGKPRRGDNAEMALLEFVQDGDRPDRKRSARKAQKAAPPAAAKADVAPAAEAVEPEATEEEPTKKGADEGAEAAAAEDGGAEEAAEEETDEAADEETEKKD